MEEFLVQAGIECHAQPLPDKYPPMMPKACFDNIAYLVRYRRSLRYCEGYVTHSGFPIAVHHAWAIDNDDRVIDPTLRDPEQYQFLGYPLLLKERRKWINRYSHAVFDTGSGRNVFFMLSHRPGLFDMIDEQYRAFIRSKLGVPDDGSEQTI